MLGRRSRVRLRKGPSDARHRRPPVHPRRPADRPPTARPGGLRPGRPGPAGRRARVARVHGRCAAHHRGPAHPDVRDGVRQRPPHGTATGVRSTRPPARSAAATRRCPPPSATSSRRAAGSPSASRSSTPTARRTASARPPASPRRPPARRSPRSAAGWPDSRPRASAQTNGASYLPVTLRKRQLHGHRPVLPGGSDRRRSSPTAARAEAARAGTPEGTAATSVTGGSTAPTSLTCTAGCPGAHTARPSRTVRAPAGR